MSRAWILFTLLAFTRSITARPGKNDEYKFVSVVFRHGDRAPDDNGHELYPNDPFLHEDFFPMGLGGLTNNGKMREFSLGKVLRWKYNKFLGGIYHPQDIVAQSTDYSRTKMSLLLVLASLFIPLKPQRWNLYLNWQPVPTTYVPELLDNLLVPEQCPQYLEELKRVVASPEVQALIEEFRPLMKELTDKTGKNIATPNDMFYLYHTLMAEYSMGLKLPEWTTDFFPNGALYDGTLLEYQITSYNDVLKKLNGGALLRRMVDDMVAKTKNGTTKARKMNIFSGHETNVAALLQTLGVFKPHVPQYSSAVFVELIQRADRYYVMVQYYLGIPRDVTTLKIPGCEELCPLDDFLRLMKNVIPTDEDLVCPKKSKDLPNHS